MKIPIPYKIIMEDLVKKSFDNEIEVKDVRLSLNWKFRFGRTNLIKIINDMVKLGLIRYKDHRTIVILWKPED